MTAMRVNTATSFEEEVIYQKNHGLRVQRQVSSNQEWPTRTRLVKKARVQLTWVGAPLKKLTTRSKLLVKLECSTLLKELVLCDISLSS